MIPVAIAVANGAADVGRGTASELTGFANRMNDVELIEVNHAPAVGSGEQNISKAVVPVNVFGAKGVPSVDGLSQGFI